MNYQPAEVTPWNPPTEGDPDARYGDVDLVPPDVTIGVYQYVLLHLSESVRERPRNFWANVSFEEDGVYTLWVADADDSKANPIIADITVLNDLGVVEMWYNLPPVESGDDRHRDARYPLSDPECLPAICAKLDELIDLWMVPQQEA